MASQCYVAAADYDTYFRKDRTMRRNPRKLIVAIEKRPNDHPESSNLWPECATLVLECGHRVNIGVFSPEQDGRQKRAACQECGAAGASREV